jgi:hypothetical protein
VACLVHGPGLCATGYERSPDDGGSTDRVPAPNRLRRAED